MATMKKEVGTDDQVKEEVREYYGAFARGSVASSYGDGDELVENERAIADELYEADQVEGLPEEVTRMSAGCGNPVARASLREGETVVDFGSGGGIDCFMAAQAVGPTGRAIGIDMTQDMIKLARSNATKVGATNVEFHLAEMESTPLEDSSVDVVISNCVISLSPDKDAVFTEAFRILRSGGRLCVSDTILTEESPAVSDSSPENWVPAGEEPRPVYMERLHRIGFQDIEIISEEPYDNDAFPNLASFTYTAYKPA